MLQQEKSPTKTLVDAATGKKIITVKSTKIIPKETPQTLEIEAQKPTNEVISISDNEDDATAPKSKGKTLTGRLANATETSKSTSNVAYVPIEYIKFCTYKNGQFHINFNDLKSKGITQPVVLPPDFGKKHQNALQQKVNSSALTKVNKKSPSKITARVISTEPATKPIESVFVNGNSSSADFMNEMEECDFNLLEPQCELREFDFLKQPMSATKKKVLKTIPVKTPIKSKVQPVAKPEVTQEKLSPNKAPVKIMIPSSLTKYCEKINGKYVINYKKLEQLKKIDTRVGASIDLTDDSIVLSDDESTTAKNNTKEKENTKAKDKKRKATSPTKGSPAKVQKMNAGFTKIEIEKSAKVLKQLKGLISSLNVPTRAKRISAYRNFSKNQILGRFFLSPFAIVTPRMKIQNHVKISTKKQPSSSKVLTLIPQKGPPALVPIKTSTPKLQQKKTDSLNHELFYTNKIEILNKKGRPVKVQRIFKTRPCSVALKREETTENRVKELTKSKRLVTLNKKLIKDISELKIAPLKPLCIVNSANVKRITSEPCGNFNVICLKDKLLEFEPFLFNDVYFDFVKSNLLLIVDKEVMQKYLFGNGE